MSMLHNRPPKYGQLGFTLIELVMALLVGSLIMAAAGSTLYQVIANNRRNTAHMLAVKQVENALHFLVRDVQMAQTINTTPPGDEVLSLTWLTWGAANNEIVYSWDPSSHRLTRTQSIDGASNTVAYSVDPKPSFSLPDGPGGRVVINMTVGVQGAQENRVVEIVPRSGG